MSLALMQFPSFRDIERLRIFDERSMPIKGPAFRPSPALNAQTLR